MLKNIFLVDDDADDQLLFGDALKEIDPSIRCEIAHNGKEAIAVLKNKSPLPDILFLDLNMPMMNGYECLTALKSEKVLSKIPVVIFTTSNDPNDAEATHQLGAHVFLSKPSDFAQLREKLHRILNLDFGNYDPAQVYLSQYSI